MVSFKLTVTSVFLKGESSSLARFWTTCTIFSIKFVQKQIKLAILVKLLLNVLPYQGLSSVKTPVVVYK